MEYINQIEKDKRINEIKSFYSKSMLLDFEHYFNPITEELNKDEHIKAIIKGTLSEVTDVKLPLTGTYWLAILTDNRIIFMHKSPYISLNAPLYEIDLRQIKDKRKNKKWYWDSGEFSIVTISGALYRFTGIKKNELNSFYVKMKTQINELCY